MGCLTVTSVGHAEHPAGASDVGEATPLRGCLRAISDCARPSRGARGCDRQVVNYCTNLRRTPYELRMGKCGHRAIGPGRPALRRLVPGHGPHSRPAQGEGTEGPVGVTLEALQPGRADHEAACAATPDGGHVFRRRRRRGHADECRLGDIRRALFQQEQQRQRQRRLIVSYEEATGRRVVLSVWTDARACCSVADLAGPAGAASPAVCATDSR